jgi:ATP-dependent DNA helicase HFM1/MER3
MELPSYSLKITEVKVKSGGKDKPVWVTISVECGLANQQVWGAKPKKQKGYGPDVTAVLTITSDLDFVDFRRIQWVL